MAEIFYSQSFFMQCRLVICKVKFKLRNYEFETLLLLFFGERDSGILLQIQNSKKAKHETIIPINKISVHLDSMLLLLS